MRWLFLFLSVLWLGWGADSLSALSPEAAHAELNRWGIDWRW